MACLGQEAAHAISDQAPETRGSPAEHLVSSWPLSLLLGQTVLGMAGARNVGTKPTAGQQGMMEGVLNLRSEPQIPYLSRRLILYKLQFTHEWGE